MLLELHIKNFALIDNVNMIFSKGFNVLTGETGAGKSILIDSINFILGDKQSKDIIRKGEESAYVEAVFEANPEDIFELLHENGIEDDDVLIISREINQNGRSISRVNGKTVTAGFLKQLGRLMVDLHGQHEHQSLLHEETHIDILDSFCDESLNTIKKEYLELYFKCRDIEKEIEKLTADEQYKLRRMDLLSFQIQEISDAKIKIGEDEELSKRREILSNAEKIFSVLSSVYSRIYEGSDYESVYDEIGRSVSQMDAITRYDERIKSIKDSLEEVYYKLEGITEDVREYKDGIDFDSTELEEIETRLDLLSKLKRKYGNTIYEILKYYEVISVEYSQMERSEEILSDLGRQLDGNSQKLAGLAQKMTGIRKEASRRLGELIVKELRYLGMEKAVFDVEIYDRERLGEKGKDTVHFMMTANPGEPMKPLSKIASGGEMSRIMLAIKSVIADIDRIPTLIFDEIDIGISGRTAQSVAEKMCHISSGHQILSVTHLPQIASMADNHFKIEKMVENDKTTTEVFNLQGEGKIDELARMLGGAELTELTSNHAREFLELANRQKNIIRG
jgi:DNA repair protein RecN (Recombination protein N)